ncbi:hypothetical protein GCM10010191_58200 [Actinomadura vinacea]|uniref:DUF998 domain-containing protein n=1 Tax=Actinomadura vinacea TaxID=115336 RepID=A0ABN3JRD2_9ACTN
MKASRKPDGPGSTPTLTAGLALVAAVAYSSFFLEHWLSPSQDSINAYVSELSAADQPYHAVYSGGDFVTGSLAVTVAIIALTTLRRRPWAVVGWIFLALFGLCAIGDAVFPLDCAPSLESFCALRERAEQVSFSHSFHAVTSSLVIIFGVVALFSLSIAARRYGWWPALARWGWLLAVIEIVCAIGTLLAMVLGRWLGIIQRLQISILILGLLTIAWALYAERRGNRAEAGGTPPARERAPHEKADGTDSRAA